MKQKPFPKSSLRARPILTEWIPRWRGWGSVSFLIYCAETCLVVLPRVLWRHHLPSLRQLGHLATREQERPDTKVRRSARVEVPLRAGTPRLAPTKPTVVSNCAYRRSASQTLPPPARGAGVLLGVEQTCHAKTSSTLYRNCKTQGQITHVFN
jgi:hypothetical protein